MLNPQQDPYPNVTVAASQPGRGRLFRPGSLEPQISNRSDRSPTTNANPSRPQLTIVFAAIAVSYWIEHQTGWSIKKFVRTACRYQTVQIQAGGLDTHPCLPGELRFAEPTATERRRRVLSPCLADDPMHRIHADPHGGGSTSRTRSTTTRRRAATRSASVRRTCRRASTYRPVRSSESAKAKPAIRRNRNAGKRQR